MQVSVYLIAGIVAVLAILLTVSSTGWTDPSGDLNDPFEYKLFDLSSQDADDMGTLFYSTGSHDSRNESPSDSNEENEDHVRDRRQDGEDDLAQDIPDDVDAEWLDHFMWEIEQASDQLLTGFDLLQQKYDNGEYDSAWSILDVVNQVGDIAGQNLTKFSTYNLDGTPGINLAALARESVTHDVGSEAELRNAARQAGEIEPSFDYLDESEHGGGADVEAPIHDLVQKELEHDASDFDDESVEKQYKTLHASMEKLTATMTSDGHLDGDYDEDDLQALTAEFWSTFSDREIDDLSLVSDGRVEEAQVKPTVFGFEKYATQLELTTDDAAFFSQQIHFEDF